MAHSQNSLKATASSHLIFPPNSMGAVWAFRRKWQAPQELKSPIIFACWKMSKNAKKKGMVWLAEALMLKKKGHFQGGQPQLLGQQGQVMRKQNRPKLERRPKYPEASPSVRFATKIYMEKKFQ